jgi:hypothetical protein
VRVPLHASANLCQTSAPAAQSARSVRSRQAQEQASCDEGCGARACVVRGAVAASCMRPVTLCRCLSCWAALPVTRSETLTHSPRCAGPAVATQRFSSNLRRYYRQGGGPRQVAGCTARRLLPSPRLGVTFVPASQRRATGRPWQARTGQRTAAPQQHSSSSCFCRCLNRAVRWL